MSLDWRNVEKVAGGYEFTVTFRSREPDYVKSLEEMAIAIEKFAERESDNAYATPGNTDRASRLVGGPLDGLLVDAWETIDTLSQTIVVRGHPYVLRPGDGNYVPANG